MSVLSVIINDIKTDIKEVGSWIKGVDWAQEVAYWQEFVKGLETVVAPVVEALFPGTTSTIKEVVTPVLDNANKAVTALGTAVQDYSAGNLELGRAYQRSAYGAGGGCGGERGCGNSGSGEKIGGPHARDPRGNQRAAGKGGFSRGELRRGNRSSSQKRVAEASRPPQGYCQCNGRRPHGRCRNTGNGFVARDLPGDRKDTWGRVRCAITSFGETSNYGVCAATHWGTVT